MNEHEDGTQAILIDILHVMKRMQEDNHPVQVLKCIQCVGDRKHEEQLRQSQPVPIDPEERDAFMASINREPLPEIRDAYTFSPSWQQTQVPSPVGMQMAMTCVALPVCYDHIEVRERTAEERAVAGGKILPGRMN